MEKENNTYWKIIREELTSAETLELEILHEKYTEETADFLREIFALQELSRGLSGMHRFEPDAAWSKIHTQLKPETKIATRWRSFSPLSLIAASIVLIIGLAGLHLYLFRTATYQNSSDQPMAIVMSDFSEVVLAPHAKLEVDRYYGLFNRELRLDGNAFFNVHSDPGKVFRVQTGYGEMEVLGTEFFVEENADRSGLQIELTEGKLSLEANSGAKYLLEHTGKVSMSNQSFESVENTVYNDHQWLGQPMVFDDLPVQEIIDRINTMYGYDLIRLTDPANGACRLHTVVYPGRIDEFINELEILFNIKCRRYKGTFDIDEINCNG